VIGSSPHWPGGTGISNLRPLAGWISALERGRFQGHKQKAKAQIGRPFRAEPKVQIHLPPAGESAANFVFGREAWKGPQGTIPTVSTSSGTDGSNPAPSSGESVSLPELLSSVENPGFPRGYARLAWRPGRQRRAGCFKIAPTGGNISVAPYSSTAAPLMGSARMPRRSQ